MSKTKWTPGPWAVHPWQAVIVPVDHLTRPLGGHDDPAIDLERYAQEICAIRWPDQHRPESEAKANGNLMAAAPELYSILHDLTISIVSDLEALRMLQGDTLGAALAVLRKARGESTPFDKATLASARGLA